MKSALLITVAAIAIALLLTFQIRTNRALRTEIARMRLQAALRPEKTTGDRNAPAPAPDPDGGLRLEIQALNARLALLRHASERSSASRPRAAFDPLPGMRSVYDARECGQATPEAAFETALWAQVHDDPAARARTCAYSADAEAELQRAFDHLTPEEQAAYGSPDGMAAALAPGILVPGGSDVQFQLMSVTPISAGVVQVTSRVQSGRGAVAELPPETFRQDSDGWKEVIPLSEVLRTTSLLSYLPPSQRLAH